MVSARLVAMFSVLVLACVTYVATEKERRLQRAADGLGAEAGADYNAPYADQVSFVCAYTSQEKRDGTHPCLNNFCDALADGSVTVETKLRHVCADGTERSVSFADVAAEKDWYTVGLEDPQTPARAGDETCAAFPESSGGVAIDSCDNLGPYMAASVAVEHWRFVNKAKHLALRSAMKAVCADSSTFGVQGCQEAEAGFKPTPGGTIYDVECPDGLGSFSFDFDTLLVELDAIVASDGGEAEVKALLYGKCSTSRRLGEDGAVHFNEPFRGTHAEVAVVVDVVVEDDAAEEPPPACISDCAALCNFADHDDGCACALACNTELCDEAEKENIASGECGRRLGVSTEGKISLSSMLKGKSSTEEDIFDLMADEDMEGEEGLARGRKLWGRRRRRWHGHWPHSHNPHSHAQTTHAFDTLSNVAGCQGCVHGYGNSCFGRCGPGCDNWNSCGNDGNPAFRACYWHDAYCGYSGMTNWACVELTSPIGQGSANVGSSGTCSTPGGNCNDYATANSANGPFSSGGNAGQGSCHHEWFAGGSGTPARAVHWWGEDSSDHSIAQCDVCDRMNWGAADANKVGPYDYVECEDGGLDDCCWVSWTAESPDCCWEKSGDSDCGGSN